MYRKCDDRECCAPYRSPLLKRLPTGFLPAPRVFEHNEDGELQLVELCNVNKEVKYATLSNILSHPSQHELPFDSFNAKVDIKQVLCPFCKVSLCNPTQLKEHRREMHFRRRVPRDEQYELKLIQEEVEEIVEVIDENGDEFLCVMKDNEDLEWKKLPPTHTLINKF